jgi:hypothetical protein
VPAKMAAAALEVAQPVFGVVVATSGAKKAPSTTLLRFGRFRLQGLTGPEPRSR